MICESSRGLTVLDALNRLGEGTGASGRLFELHVLAEKALLSKPQR